MTQKEIDYLLNTNYTHSVNTSLALVGVRHDNLIEIRFKSDDYDVDTEDQNEIDSALMKLTNNGQNSHSIIVIPGLYGSITKEARDMEIFDRDLYKNMTSMAVVVHALHQRILASFFFKFKKTKPNFPTKLFHSENSALEWITTQ